MKSYTMRHNATRAARQALGREAVEGTDFHLTTSGPDDCIAWHWADGPAGATETVTPPDAPQTAQDGDVASDGPAPRATKGRAVLAMLQREGGASLDQIMEATGWQRHTARGFLAGAQLKAMGYKATRTETHYTAQPIDQDHAA